MGTPVTAIPIGPNPVAVLEAAISGADGTVKEVHVEVGETIEADDLMAKLEG